MCYVTGRHERVCYARMRYLPVRVKGVEVVSNRGGEHHRVLWDDTQLGSAGKI